jgi:hypothetical protein
MAQWRQDLGNVIDVLSARPDIDSSRIACTVRLRRIDAFPLIVLEDRIKTAVLAPSGSRTSDAARGRRSTTCHVRRFRS